MSDFRIVYMLTAPFKAIQESQETIRGSPSESLQNRANEQINKALKEVRGFLDKLGPGVRLVRIIPYARDGTLPPRPFITGKGRFLSLGPKTHKLSVEIQDGRSAKKWKKEIIPLEEISQIQIWEPVVREQ